MDTKRYARDVLKCNIESVYMDVGQMNSQHWNHYILKERALQMIGNEGCGLGIKWDIWQLALFPFSKFAYFTEILIAFISWLDTKEMSIYIFEKVGPFGNRSYAYVKIIKYSRKRDYWVFRKPCRSGKFYMEIKLLLS